MLRVPEFPSSNDIHTNTQTMQTQHVPVMLEEVLKYLQPEPGGSYVDGTLGGGGHTEAILERTAPDGKVLGIDSDAQALSRAKERLAESVSNGRLVLVHGNFAELARIVHEAGFVSIQGVLLDLGFSSDQMSERRPPDKRVKLPGGDRFKGTRVLCAGAHERSFKCTAPGGRVARSLSAIR